VYTDGYDSHSNSAYHYWPKKFTHIKDTPEEVNKIEDDFPEWRQASKTITFAALYGGTYHTFMSNGFTEKEAKEIEANYHKMHKVCDDWVDGKILTACDEGYVNLAFGGRLRTPILSQVVYGDIMPYKAQEEKRSAGNALMQSYCMLTVRAMTKFMELVWKSEYKYDIKPIATIHDSIYLLVRNNVGCLKWVNDNLIKVMGWTGLPELQHPIIDLPSILEIYPNWAKPIKLDNDATKKEILKLCKGK